MEEEKLENKRMQALNTGYELQELLIEISECDNEFVVELLKNLENCDL